MAPAVNRGDGDETHECMGAGCEQRSRTAFRKGQGMLLAWESRVAVAWVQIPLGSDLRFGSRSFQIPPTLEPTVIGSHPV